MVYDRKKQLGQRIKSLRQQAGLKQEWVAEQIGIDAKSLSRIERGAHYPSLETLDAISASLGVTLGDFFDDSAGTDSEATLRAYLAGLAASLDLSRLRLVAEAAKKVLGKG
ncbi:MAG: helix-turn-helix transcriptional regulator [Moraxellaceae bacterium]|nr:helix-turn-helix transcriptional regulator [Moraxellaceae bacterium]